MVKRPALLLAVVCALTLTLTPAPAPATPRPLAARNQLATQLQPPAMYPGNRLAHVGDISQPTNEFNGGDNATAELLRTLAPDLICNNGDLQYETGAEAMFRAETGFNGTFGRLLGPKLVCPAMGNHDMADGGTADGRAPGWTNYFAPVLANLACKSDPTPCHPEQGWYGIDLDADRDGAPDWYVVVVNTNCGRAGGGTGDTGSPSCANDSPQVNWMRAFMAARHGGAHDGRKASLLLGHHEPFGTCFFNDDRDSSGQLVTRYITQVWQHFHGDVGLFGHSHSTGRWGILDWNGAPATSGSRWITSGAGGRSLTPCRVSGTRPNLRYRNDTKFGVGLFTLSVTHDPAGWIGGTWNHEFWYTDGTRADSATAGIWP